MTIFKTQEKDIAIHESGWLQMPSGVWLTRLPLMDSAHSPMFAHTGKGTARRWLTKRGARLATWQELEELNVKALHIEPFTLPTGAMLRASGIDLKSQTAIDAYRNKYMSTYEWCRIHDLEVWKRLDDANWISAPVANAGKHWVQGGIYGWWRASGGMWQPTYSGKPYDKHGDDHHDYASNAHGASDVHPDQLHEPEPDAKWTDCLSGGESLGLRCLAWLAFQSAQGIHEIPGARHDPRILAYSKDCRRGGFFVGVAEFAKAIWRGGVRLALGRDEDPWCATTASKTLLETLRPGEEPPHGLRVSVRELCEDAKFSNTLRTPEYIPNPGDLAILGRLGESPIRGGRGHVRRVVSVMGPDYLGIGGNESDTIITATHSLADVEGWIAYPQGDA